MNLNRVVFYSGADGAIPRELEKAQIALDSFNTATDFSINDILELHNIKQYVDNNAFHRKWTDTEIELYRNNVKLYEDIITKYFINNGTQILKLLDTIDFDYVDDYWSLIAKLGIFKSLPKDSLRELFICKNFNVSQLLKHKLIVEYFSKPIHDYLSSNFIECAEIILAYYEQEDSLRDKDQLFFPKTLDNASKEDIIVSYLDSEEPNLNYIELIVNSKFIALSDRTKLKAKKKHKLLSDKIFNKGSVWSRGLEVSISRTQIKPLEIKYVESTKYYTYSDKYLSRKLNYIDVFLNFSILFNYINNQGCVELVTKKYKIDTIETIFMRSKGEYFISSDFYEKSLLSDMQMHMYIKYLEDENIYLEEVLSEVVNTFLNENYEIKNLKIKLPSKDSSLIEKIRMLAPEIESIVKQYQSYIVDGYIDFELLEFSTSILYLGEIKSKVTNKYLYGASDEFYNLKNSFFSSQSLLYYIDRFKEKYDNLYNLLENEDVKYDEFKGYQITQIDYLINEGYLLVDGSKNVKIKAHNAIEIIRLLYLEDVISFWHYSKELRDEMLRLQKSGIVEFDNKLFTREERKYLNYYLNKKEFSNSLDLRNKYLHGSNSDSVEKQRNDYYKLLKLVVLVIFKINNDLNLDLYIKELKS